jgi:quinol monooxygenase YgiN
MIVVSGLMIFDPAEHERVLPLAQAIAAATRAEPGCLAYGVWVDPTAPERYHVFEEWADAAALAAHAAAPHVAEFMRALRGISVRSVEFTRYEVSSKRALF